MLSLLGLKSIADAAKGAAAAGGYPTLSAEFILKSNPDYIVLTDTGPTGGGQSAATVSRRPGWSVLTAVKDKHIISLNADIASRWGPRDRGDAAGRRHGAQARIAVTAASRPGQPSRLPAAGPAVPVRPLPALKPVHARKPGTGRSPRPQPAAGAQAAAAAVRPPAGRPRRSWWPPPCCWSRS